MDVKIKRQGTFCGGTPARGQLCPAHVQMEQWVWQCGSVDQGGVAGVWLTWGTAGRSGWVR